MVAEVQPPWRHGALGRPGVVLPPGVRATLEHVGFGLAEAAAILEVVCEERRLDAVPEILGCGAAEVDVAEHAALAGVPAAVIPRADHEKVLVVAIELLEPLVDRDRTVKVLLV